MRKSCSTATAILFLTLAASLFAQTSAKRPIAIEDMYRMQEVDDPQTSPDGKWIAYTVKSIDREADKHVTSIWMVNWEGTQDMRLTFGSESAESPQWSPDGKFLSFLTSRPADARSQIWLLDRRGGEAQVLTDVKGDIGGYRWSPDAKTLVLEISNFEEEQSKSAVGPKFKGPKPIVIDRDHFKEDIEGYLTTASRSQLYLFDVATKKLTLLTTDKSFNDRGPAWSPDGKRIAYVSNHSETPDIEGTNDIFIIDARPGATPQKLLTTYSPGEQKLAWSPDGKLLAYLVGFEAKYNAAYNQARLAVVSTDGGTPRMLTEKLDRGIASPEFTADGTAITFSFEDDRHAYPAKIAVAGGEVEKLAGADYVVIKQSGEAGHLAVAAANDTTAVEIFALEDGKLRKLTSHNDALLSEIQLGAVEDISFKSKDGTEVHGMMVKPPSFEKGKKYPTLLWIHGGGNMQDDHALRFNLYPLQLERQLFAARGYVVLAINYRGSAGRGAEYTRAIFADWGNKEVADLLAGVDFAVASGITDPNRLGIGGWSYGGILTDFTIASDNRFKAAISGAGAANELSMFGSDQYIQQYRSELGPPWQNLDAYLKVSYPFFKADRIQTPTLFMGGQNDFNVPIIGSEQMYQALRWLKVPTELVVYPEQFHLFTRPSYIHDRRLRYYAWFDKYLKEKN